MRAALAPFLAVALAASALSAAAAGEAVNFAAERAAIEQFQQADQRLQDVGWKLVRGNAAFCRDTLPSIGLQLQDLASYGRPHIARAALEMDRDFAVQTAATGSPADLSGAFTSNREVRSIGTVDPNNWNAGERLDWQRLKRAHDAIDETLERTGELQVFFADNDEVRVAPVTVCATRFELAGRGGRAVADGERVVIGVKFPGFAYPEELFAAAVAHELAHNFLSHSAWLDRNKRKRSNVRATEREADRLMPWLLANAGYDPAAAMRFFEEYKPSSGSVLFLPGSHEKWQARAKAVRGELPQISQLMERAGKADWSSHFKREIDPKKGQ